LIIPEPGKSWKSTLALKILEIKAYGSGTSWKNILENHAFFIDSNGKQAAVAI